MNNIEAKYIGTLKKELEYAKSEYIRLIGDIKTSDLYKDLERKNKCLKALVEERNSSNPTLWNEVIAIAVKAYYYLNMSKEAGEGHYEDYINEMKKLENYSITRK